MSEKKASGGFLKFSFGSGQQKSSSASSSGIVDENPFRRPIDTTQQYTTTEELRLGLLQMYLCYCPAELTNIPKLISKFRVVGRQALAETHKRFEQLPLPGETDAVLRTCPRTRLCAFYAHYAPEKLSSVDYLLDKYRGHYEELWSELIQKYGPERPAYLLFADWEEREQEEKMRHGASSPEGNTVHRASSVLLSNDSMADSDQSSLLGSTIVFSTGDPNGQQTIWRRDAEQAARDLGRSHRARDDDASSSQSSPLSLENKWGSFAAFSPVYPEPVLRRAQSLMLREGESASSPTSADTESALDATDVGAVFKALHIDPSTLCPVGGRAGEAFPPLPDELSPTTLTSPPSAAVPMPAVAPILLNTSMGSASNMSFLMSPSPRSQRRRNPRVSFVLGEEARDALTSPSTAAAASADAYGGGVGTGTGVDGEAPRIPFSPTAMARLDSSPVSRLSPMATEKPSLPSGAFMLPNARASEAARKLAARDVEADAWSPPQRTWTSGSSTTVAMYAPQSQRAPLRAIELDDLEKL